jgi:histone-lysine N-methyltransferase SETD3
MCNHSFTPNAQLRPGPGRAVSLVALTALAPGEPVLISYGQLSNGFFLLDYGFIVPGNPHDSTELRFDAALLQVLWKAPSATTSVCC